MRRSLLGACCALFFASAVLAAPDANQLILQATQAYQAKHFAEAAELYVAAAKAGANKIDSSYNAACSYALSGNVDKAFEQLQVAIDAGLRQDPTKDADLDALHADTRWKPIAQRFSLEGDKYMPILNNQDIPSASRYFTGRQAVADGVPVWDSGSMFNQFYGTVAQYVGEYDEAVRIYGHARSRVDPVEGYTQAVDAIPVVLARAQGRQAVFLNEAHGLAATRAANYALLPGLRAQGFDVLAVETLRSPPPVPRDAEHCSDAAIEDLGLATRGYPVVRTGYYTADPVYAEMIREALRLGFRLVAYDSYHEEHDQGQREQTQAENLACIFKADPKAKLVVLAGFAHINEGESDWVPGGMMARRFRGLTGIDPLSVDTAMHTYLDPKQLGLETTPGARLAPSYVLQNANGESYGGPQVDLSLFVPTAAHRNDGQPSWLELGGARKRVAVARAECKDKDPCLVEARHIGEDPKAVPSDRCVVGGADAGCTLFLPPGKYEVATYDSAGAELSRRGTEVDKE
jgi:tetratricopeptide (TPR) repeat protein